MLKISEFSKLSHLTIRALRFYDREGLLRPASVDEWNHYRFYETSQLETAAKIKAYRQLGLSIEEIRKALKGGDIREILHNQEDRLLRERETIDHRLSVIHSIMEDKEMVYQVTEKIIPEKIIYSSETTVTDFSEVTPWILSVGEECLKLNPTIQCEEPGYEFCEYPEGEYKDRNFRIRHNEAVTFLGRENEHIQFRILPETRVLSIYHRGPYEKIGESYAFLMNYAEQNGYKSTGLTRECYIDGVWNKESEEEWLTEIQLPIE